MPSFRQVCADAPVLLVDAASSVIQVGLLGSEGTAKWDSSNDESGVAIFQGIARLGIDPQEMSTFIFCEGPGSVLGIRTAAMALRTWCALRPRRVFAYSSLAVVAHALGRMDLGVISDARRDSWHHYQMARGIRRIAAAELTGDLVMPEHFRHWSALPAGVTTVPYSLADMLPVVRDFDLLRETASPDAFLHEEPSYVTWTPQIHRPPQE